MSDEIGVSAWHNEQTATFWSWAEAERDEAPESVHPLIERKVKRIVVTRAEARQIAEWAKEVIGWERAHPAPLRFSDRETGGTLEPSQL